MGLAQIIVFSAKEENMAKTTNIYKDVTDRMLKFIDESPTCFHVVDNLKKQLVKNGFTELKESELWKLSPASGSKKGGKYFVTRNDSSIISFKIPKKDFKGFYMIASHSDSPSFKIKENPEMESGGAYVKLNVEKYGGMLCAEWFDRPLSVAGRLIVRDKNGAVKTKLVNVDRDLLIMTALSTMLSQTCFLSLAMLMPRTSSLKL